uniref:Bifunctional protein FolD n=1 Tax=Anthurium amnicola TaxID=1678845 RepID=A0A1D1XTA8_9ARAE
MSTSMVEPTFSISNMKKSSRLSRPKPRSIYTDVVIPECASNNKNQGITSPIPSGHLETSTRFWQFRVEEGLITYVRFGSIRADGSLKGRATHIQQHPCYGDARQFVENLIDEKIKAGYVGWARW